VLGVCNALWIPFWNTIIVDISDKRKRGKEIGFLNSTFWIFYGLAGIGGASIAYFFGFKLMFITVGIVNLVATVFLVLMDL
jgi:MFS family permease